VYFQKVDSFLPTNLSSTARRISSGTTRNSASQLKIPQLWKAVVPSYVLCVSVTHAPLSCMLTEIRPKLHFSVNHIQFLACI